MQVDKPGMFIQLLIFHIRVSDRMIRIILTYQVLIGE